MYSCWQLIKTQLPFFPTLLKIPSRDSQPPPPPHWESTSIHLIRYTPLNKKARDFISPSLHTLQEKG